jgi:hypothetical protein
MTDAVAPRTVTGFGIVAKVSREEFEDMTMLPTDSGASAAESAPITDERVDAHALVVGEAAPLSAGQNIARMPRAKQTQGGGRPCEHNRRKNRCKECGGSRLCWHGIRKNRCKECRQ